MHFWLNIRLSLSDFWQNRKLHESRKWNPRASFLSYQPPRGEYGRKQTIQKDESRRSSKGWKQTIRGESRRSMGQSRRSRAKADDLGSKADDLLGQSRRSMGQSRRSRSKRTIWRAESRRSYGPKRTILFEIWTILFEVKRNHAILRDESRRSYGPKRTILSEVYETLQSWGMKADDPWIYFMKNQND